jgi:hypothetical protein
MSLRSRIHRLEAQTQLDHEPTLGELIAASYQLRDLPPRDPEECRASDEAELARLRAKRGRSPRKSVMEMLLEASLGHNKPAKAP